MQVSWLAGGTAAAAAAAAAGAAHAQQMATSAVWMLIAVSVRLVQYAMQPAGACSAWYMQQARTGHSSSVREAADAISMLRSLCAGQTALPCVHYQLKWPH
jgi:hypothetical protein